jgi:hypothetical protein
MKTGKFLAGTMFLLVVVIIVGITIENVVKKGQEKEAEMKVSVVQTNKADHIVIRKDEPIRFEVMIDPKIK